jgi:hypothetical protein
MPGPSFLNPTGPAQQCAGATGLTIGLQRSAIGTLVERTTRFTMLIYLPREEGYGLMPHTKSGPALAGCGAVTMENAVAWTITIPPEQLRRSLIWDSAKELSAHAQFKVETGVPVFFALRPAQGARAAPSPAGAGRPSWPGYFAARAGDLDPRSAPCARYRGWPCEGSIRQGSGRTSRSAPSSQRSVASPWRHA